MGYKKLAHITPELQKILETLKSDTTKHNDINDIIQHTFVEPGSFESNSEEPSDKEQELELSFKIDLGFSGKKPTKKKQKTEEKTPPAVFFGYESKWTYDGGLNSYSASLKLTDEDGDPVKDIINFKATKQFEIRAESEMDIDWEVIDEIKLQLKTNVEAAHLLEILRCSVYCRKSTRLVPDKWILPSTRPDAGGKQHLEDCAIIGRKTKRPLPSAKDLAEFD